MAFPKGISVNTHEILVKAKELIKEREFWIKGSNATDSDGVSTAILSPYACRFWMNGAILRITGFDRPTQLYDDARRALYAVLPGGDSIHRFNDADKTTHADVMSMFDKAISLASNVDSIMKNREAQ